MPSLRSFVEKMPAHLRLPDDPDRSAPLTLRHVIGSGAGGTAISATLTSNESERRCIKIMEISTKEQRYKEVLERCRLEALSLSRCNSVFIVKYYDSFEVADPPRNLLYFALVCEECVAGDLRNQVKLRVSGRHGVGVFSEMEALLLFVQILMALTHIHEHRMSHRDLKSANVFMTNIGAVKLGDFGFAKSFMDSLSLFETVCGTPDMMAPELWRRNRYTKKVDIYALGVVLYELLTGQRPFERSLEGVRSIETIAQATLERNPDPLPAHISEATCALVASLLGKDPAARPSCRDLMQLPLVVNTIDRLASVLPDSPEHAEVRAAIIKEIQENNRFMRPGLPQSDAPLTLEARVNHMLAGSHLEPGSGESWAAAAEKAGSVLSPLWVGSTVRKLSSEQKWKSRFLRIASLDGSQFDLAVVVTRDGSPLAALPAEQKQIIRFKYVDDVHTVPPEQVDNLENVMLISNCRIPNFYVQFSDAETFAVWHTLLKELIAEQVYAPCTESHGSP